MKGSILLALLPLAAACGTDPGPDPNLTGNENPDGVVFLAQNQPATVHMQALYEGLVTRDAEGCLRLRGHEGRAGATVIWPYGTKLQGRGAELLVISPSGREIGRIGGKFTMGGGNSSDRAASLTEADRALARQRCPGEFWIAGEIEH